MRLRNTYMEYDDELDRWVVQGRDEWYSLHCGEIIQLHIGSQVLNARLEYGLTWYVIVEGVKLGLPKHERFTVSMDI